MPESYTFAIAAPQYTHRSGGIRALYRLCQVLNLRGIPTAILPLHPFDTLPIPPVPLVDRVRPDTIVIYPEVVLGNPAGATRVVRWCLNYPGHLGGGVDFPEQDFVFVLAELMRPRTAALLSRDPATIGVLPVPLIDPAIIFDDGNLTRTELCCFTHHGRDLRTRFPPPPGCKEVEECTPSYWHLGTLLRQSKSLYAYDHASTILREAVISGCAVYVMHDDGCFLDPRTCGCTYNAVWDDGFETNYRARFHDLSCVDDLLFATGVHGELDGNARAVAAKQRR